MKIPKFLYHGTTMKSYEYIKKTWSLSDGYLLCYGDIDYGAKDWAFKRAYQEIKGHPIIIVIDGDSYKRGYLMTDRPSSLSCS